MDTARLLPFFHRPHHSPLHTTTIHFAHLAPRHLRVQPLGAQALQTDRPAPQGRELPGSFHMVAAYRDALARGWGSAGPTLRNRRGALWLCGKGGHTGAGVAPQAVWMMGGGFQGSSPAVTPDVSGQGQHGRLAIAERGPWWGGRQS